MVTRGGICKYLIVNVERWIGTLTNKYWCYWYNIKNILIWDLLYGLMFMLNNYFELSIKKIKLVWNNLTLEKTLDSREKYVK